MWDDESLQDVTNCLVCWLRSYRCMGTNGIYCFYLINIIIVLMLLLCRYQHIEFDLKNFVPTIFRCLTLTACFHMVIVIVSIRYVLAQIGKPSKAVLRSLIYPKQCCISYDLASSIVLLLIIQSMVLPYNIIIYYCECSTCGKCKIMSELYPGVLKDVYN